MPRIARQLLIASLIAFHAAVTLCGPCLHAMPGLSHESGPESSAKKGHSFDSESTHHTSADTCPICHFLAQGQLAVESSSIPAVQFVDELASPAHPGASPSSPHLPSCPRAPPADAVIVS